MKYLFICSIFLISCSFKPGTTNHTKHMKVLDKALSSIYVDIHEVKNDIEKLSSVDEYDIVTITLLNDELYSLYNEAIQLVKISKYPSKKYVRIMNYYKIEVLKLDLELNKKSGKETKIIEDKIQELKNKLKLLY